MVCAQFSILSYWRSERRCIGDSCPRHRRALDYLGEFLRGKHVTPKVQSEQKTEYLIYKQKVGK